jgi:glutamyl/glutaminyl-tRNA synthetase
MVSYLALFGWNNGTNNKIFMHNELIKAFDVNRIVKNPGIFDIDKLRWLNLQHLKRIGMEHG